MALMASRYNEQDMSQLDKVDPVEEAATVSHAVGGEQVGCECCMRTQHASGDAHTPDVPRRRPTWATRASAGTSARLSPNRRLLPAWRGRQTPVSHTRSLVWRTQASWRR